ncbi:metal-dependent hydrolase family protein [Halomarina pelagica]|uniref:metal-dependent hydrolase family protein n=1 Tax=Halomarina pelagica TaxID=2961599 RepID=UPI0020C28494|nr:amidohydrolase family protein [Halomarina sp. BND7]
MLTVDCGTLIDGITDEPRYDARVVIEDGRIAAVGPRDEVEAVGEQVEHDVVIPGLVDAHVHLAGVRSMDPMDWAREDVATMTARATADLRRLLAAGFTSVRDVGSATGLGLRTAVSEGVIPGPRIYTSGRAFSQTGGHGDSHFLPYEWSRSRAGLSEIVDGPDECRKGARRRIRDGVDCIKIMATGGVLSEKDAPDQSQYTAAEIRAFAEEAHRVGIPVAAHAQGAPGMKNALRNGVDTIEHGFYVDDEAIDLLLETDATFVPTLAIMHRIVAEGADHGMPEWGLRKAREAQRAHLDSTRRVHEAGVPVALGTDFIGPDLVPHGENALEAELLVSAVGLSEMEAIRAATSVAARTVPGDEVGAIEAGRYGDLVALGSDPLDDVAALRDVEAVYKGGEAVR